MEMEISRIAMQFIKKIKLEGFSSLSFETIKLQLSKHPGTGLKIESRIRIENLGINHYICNQSIFDQMPRPLTEEWLVCATNGAGRIRF